MPFKPAGYPSVSPYLVCAGQAKAVIAFLEAAFGGVVTRRYDHDDGRVMHAEVRIDDSIVMIGDSASGGAAAHLHLYVPDVDAVFARAVAAGGVVVQAPVQKGDPDKRGGVTDPAGHTWWIATQLG